MNSVAISASETAVGVLVVNHAVLNVVVFGAGVGRVLEEAYFALTADVLTDIIAAAEDGALETLDAIAVVGREVMEGLALCATIVIRDSGYGIVHGQTVGHS